MQEQVSNYSDMNTNEIRNNSQNAKPVPYKLPPSQIGQIKRELIYIFFFETIGTLSLTYAVYASNNNPFVIAAMYGVLFMIAQNQKCTFNPAITLILGLKEKATWVSVAIASQFFGAIMGGLIGFIFFKNQIENAAYLNVRTNTQLFGDFVGELLGSMVLSIGIIFQYDELLDFTNNALEHSVIIASLYAFARTLTYTSQSLLNPAIAFSLEFFESCKDGQWSRFGFFWIFTFVPIGGAFLATLFIRFIYKPCFEKQIKLGLKF